MIIKLFELQKNKKIKTSLNLIYGNNQGQKNQIIKDYLVRDFQGNVLKYEEDYVINNSNNFISNLLNQSLFDQKKILVINRVSDKILNIISKDTKGDPSKLEIIIISNFKVSNSEKLLLEKKLKVKNNYNNISDKLKLKKYESIIIENLSEKISDNIIFLITNLNDN